MYNTNIFQSKSVVNSSASRSSDLFPQINHVTELLNVSLCKP